MPDVTYVINKTLLLRFELSTTGAEIARLWTLLRIPTADREAFQASFKVRTSYLRLSLNHNLPLSICYNDYCYYCKLL